ncbi:MAG: single-stranded DNA-binding protein [Spirochaeta sp. LUC14_002_19_P3]|nr:MAG: single-stranded DNA-binding protein [Spirochaeta sp. LUC14_002_19_P3]
MADINKVVLIGRLTRDAEQTYTQSGYTVIKFSIAVNRRRKQGDKWVDEANFFDVTSFGRQGEAIVSYMNKGRQVAVEGQLRQDRWEAQDGTKRSKVYVEASYIQLIGGRKDGYSDNSQSDDDWTSRLSPSEPAADMPTANFEDDIPF